MKKSERWLTIIKNNYFLLNICSKGSPKFVFLYIVDVIRNDLVIFLEFTFGLNFILECVEYQKPFSYVLTYLTFLFFFVVMGLFYNAWFHEKYKPQMLPVIKSHIKEILYNKAKEVDIECYDNPGYYNDFILAISESDNQIERVFLLLQKIVSSMTTFILTGTFFVLVDTSSLLLVWIIFVMSYTINQIQNKLDFEIRIKKIDYERKREYVKRIFYFSDYAKEIRLNTKLSEVLFNKFREANFELYNIEEKSEKKRFVLDIMKEYILSSFLLDVIFMIYLTFKAVVLHTISYSNVLVLFKATSKLKNSLDLFAEIYPFASETSMYVEKIRHFLHTKSKIDGMGVKPLVGKPSVLEFKHVYFSYNNDNNYELSDINMRIEISKKIAIVGLNGAGKTTLIKLIMRFYDVSKGEILLDNINIKDYNLSEYRERIGVVFQDYKIYAASLLENVLLDDIKNPEKKLVYSSLKKSGLEHKVKELCQGLETQLTAEFDEDGVELSMGECQKVAISRLFYRNNSIIILDEPSSALDPISEFELNKKILYEFQDKMLIFISHRLSTIRDSDYIYVMCDGKIVETGTHTELLQKENIYSRMWNKQASNYKAEVWR
jgi:ATP-binding cassette subfamily B protein